MAQGRLRSPEVVRYDAPENGANCWPLEPAPQVRTMRIKLKDSAEREQAFSGGSTLGKELMPHPPRRAAVLYVDRHVRVYHGTAKVLPKHDVAREHLYLSATAD
jgi:transposase-like protein